MTRLAGRIVTGLAAPLGAAGLFASAVAQSPPAPPAPVPSPAPASVPVFDVEVVARYPHDRDAFTQGLIWRDGQLYESVGREGRSEVRRVRLADGHVLARSAIPPSQFGEGLAAHGSELVSLTWHDGIAHRWDAKTLERRGASRYAGEGWGLASTGRELVLSDGSPTLRFLDPTSFAERRRVDVTLRGRRLDQLNELEWVDGRVLANVWHSPYLVRIVPETGVVDGVVDLTPLVREIAAADPEAVANGVAWDPVARRLFVTGKLWPTLFEVRLRPRG
jgi:glutamine cyclotransferase